MQIERIHTVATHILQGVMFHEQMMNCYLFLGLPGYSRCHEYHYLEESKSYIAACRFTIDHYDSLVIVTNPVNQNVIPTSWFSSFRGDVTNETKKEAIASAFDEWITWEQNTVELYERYYKLACDNKESVLAEFIKQLLLDADGELCYAKQEKICKAAIDFDLVSITEEQDAVSKVFDKKIRKLYKEYGRQNGHS